MDKIYCILHSSMFCSDPIFLNRSGTIAFLKNPNKTKMSGCVHETLPYKLQQTNSQVSYFDLFAAPGYIISSNATKVHGLISPRGQMINLFLYFPRRNLFFSRDIANKTILFSGQCSCHFLIVQILYIFIERSCFYISLCPQVRPSVGPSVRR